jgi:hypothetical protein
MKLTFDTDTSRLIQDVGYASPVPFLEAKRGTGSKIQLTLLRDGVPWIAPALSQFRFIVKPKGKYAVEDTLALCESWTLDAVRKVYEGRINYATDALNLLLKIADPSGENTDTGRMTLASEFAWRETDSVPWGDRSDTVEFILHNNLWRGTEVTPGAPASEGSTVPLYQLVTVTLPTGTVVNNNATPNTLQDVTGLKFPVEAGKRYDFRFVIPYAAAAGTTGSRWAINGPAFSALHLRSTWSNGAAAEVVAYGNAYNQPAAASANSVTAGNVAILEGQITAAANGDVIARFASEIANSAITVQPGARVSYMVLPTA